MSLQDQINSLVFEMQRRVILFNPNTTMPDGTTLGSTSGISSTQSPQELYLNPPATPGNGALLLIHSPIGTRYQDANGVQYYKRRNPTTLVLEWVAFVASTGSGSVDLAVNSGLELVDDKLRVLRDFKLGFLDTAWIEVGEFFEINVLKTVHLQGDFPMFALHNASGESVGVDSVVISSGDIKLKIPKSISNIKFDGYLLVKKNILD